MSMCETGRWLTKSQYQQIRRDAKKMGALDVNLAYIFHLVTFTHVSVFFAFRPLVAHASIVCNNIYDGHFSDKAVADAIKADMDKALSFMDYLRDFDRKVDTEGKIECKERSCNESEKLLL